MGLEFGACRACRGGAGGIRNNCCYFHSFGRLSVAPVGLLYRTVPCAGWRIDGGKEMFGNIQGNPRSQSLNLARLNDLLSGTVASLNL